MLSLMVSGCPSLIQVTVVAGEPVDVQVRMEDKDPSVNVKLIICGEAAHVEEQNMNGSVHFTMGQYRFVLFFPLILK